MDNNGVLQYIKDTIEVMNKTNQIEILKILKKNTNVKLNENKSGVFVNLSYLPDETINDLKNYLQYINNQEKELQKVETQKKEFEESFFLEN